MTNRGVGSAPPTEPFRPPDPVVSNAMIYSARIDRPMAVCRRLHGIGAGPGPAPPATAQAFAGTLRAAFGDGA